MDTFDVPPRWLRDVELAVLGAGQKGRPFVLGEENRILGRIVAVPEGDALGLDSDGDTGLRVVLRPARDTEILVVYGERLHSRIPFLLWFG